MNKITKIIAVLLLLAITLSMTACGEKKRVEPTTALDLVNQSITSMSELQDNYAVNMQIVFDLKMDMEVENAKIDISVPFKVITNADVANKYIHGDLKTTGSMDVTMEYDGKPQTQIESIDESIEFYIDSDNDDVTTYIKNHNQEKDAWKQSTSASTPWPSYQLVLQPSLFENAEIETIDNTYVVSIRLSDLINHPEVQNILDTEYFSELTNTDLDIATLVNACGDSIVTYTFDKDCRLVSMTTGKINLNLLGAFDNDSLSELGLTNIDDDAMTATISLDVRFSRFGEIKNEDVKPSEEIVKSTLNNQTSSEENDDNKSTSTKHDSSSISNKWTDMDIQIDGIVYNYPYNYNQLSANGWFVDLEASNYGGSTILDKNEETYTTIDLFHDVFNNPANYDGMMADIGFRNLTNEKADIMECAIWAIDLNISYGATLVPQYPNVVIANGITWGSTEEQVIAAFGDPSEMYESPSGEREFKSLTWNTDDYSKTMEITIDKEFGVIAISYSTYMR